MNVLATREQETVPDRAMRLAVRVVEHVAVGVEDRRLAKRVVGVFLTNIAELIQHRRDVAVLVLFVDRYLAAGVEVGWGSELNIVMFELV